MSKAMVLRTALVSLDWRRSKDPLMSLGHASISASLKHAFGFNSLEQKYKVRITDHCFDTLQLSTHGGSSQSSFDSFCHEAVDDILSQSTPHLVGFGVFIWNEKFVQKMTAEIKRRSKSTIICLGGPQVSYSPRGSLEELYPHANVFIRGYAENAMVKLVRSIVDGKEEPIAGVHWAGSIDLGLQALVDLKSAPSPFLPISPNHDALIDTRMQKFIRWESQRGCPFRCSFCQHKDQYAKRESVAPERVLEEINLFKTSNVSDIAVLDPTFNSGPNFMGILNRMIGYQGKLSLQVRFEMITDEFIHICKKLCQEGCSLILEFGIQTTQALEFKYIRRPNRLEKIKQVSEKLVKAGIPFEVSLIYGLPGQTVASFKQSIDFCQDLGPMKLVAWPLMLLRGTELHSRKEELKLQERLFTFAKDCDIVDGSSNRILFGIPHVISSPTFSESDWFKMQKIASSL